MSHFGFSESTMLIVIFVKLFNQQPTTNNQQLSIMSQNTKTLHPRNLHKGSYNFPELIKSCPDLEPYVYLGKSERLTIDFANQNALKLLNKALLIHFYGIKFWDIPDNYLCPAVPSRADYLHYAADLLADPHTGEIPRGRSVRVLDIGVGANCVYPIIGHRQYGWHFVGTDIDKLAIKAAKAIVEANAVLKEAITIRLQNNKEHILKNVIKPGERFDLCVCNPPFFDSKNQAVSVSEEKWKKLGVKVTTPAFRNFGGQDNELETEGGEIGFIKRLIIESKEFADSFKWFTTLVSNRNSLFPVQKALKKAKVKEFKVMESTRGQKMSRIMAWTFKGFF